MNLYEYYNITVDPSTLGNARPSIVSGTGQMRRRSCHWIFKQTMKFEKRLSGQLRSATASGEQSPRSGNAIDTGGEEGSNEDGQDRKYKSSMIEIP